MSQASGDIERLRRIACTGNQHDETGALEWFSLLSERLDQMKTLEDALTATLMQCCREAIEQAQQQATSPIVQGDSNFSLYVCGADWLPGASTLSSDGLAPQLGRSVLSLIGEQSQRLQQQADELASMRASLDERRVIDQAKHWLMQQQGFTEEAAWQALRKSAMNQNKRVLEIAQAVLAVAKTLNN